MLLSRATILKLNNDEANIIGHMCYAAYKLWNTCNYERIHYKELIPETYPDWYYQKKMHKDDLWYKQLPSQTAQEVLKVLDKSWKSFYALSKSHGVENPRPPHYKHDNIPVTYMQNGISHEKGSSRVRLSLPRQLKEYMRMQYDIHDNYIYAENRIFSGMDNIKQIHIYPPSGGACKVIAVYEIPDSEMKTDNGKYLSVDLGIHNLMTCYNSDTGETFIAGRRYFSICRYYDRKIAGVQSQWSESQFKKGIKYPKSSVHISRLHQKKKNSLNDYLHKVTCEIAKYCVSNSINTVVIGDITGIREGTDFGNVTNQKLHALPYKKIYGLLEYKLRMKGITLIKQKEQYTSQTSPLSPAVDRAHAVKAGRIYRGLYRDGAHEWNADCVGAFNILRLYIESGNIHIVPDPAAIKVPYILKVAV